MMTMHVIHVHAKEGGRHGKVGGNIHLKIDSRI